ncbi:MAG TPA: hypothetical protein VNT75_11015 [Symbiobacteriaceae bacterium]|nr:hypothetical protein [Symbiobacteriaceae bacterium]
MQDWDRLVMIGFGAGATIYSFVVARRLWRQAERRAAAGLALLGVSASAVPAVLALVGG